MNKYTPTEGKFFVTITESTPKEQNKFYTETGEMKSAGSGIRVFKRAEILYTSDEKTFPVGSFWMIGETPGLIINYFGEKIVEIQEKDIHARID